MVYGVFANKINIVKGLEIRGGISEEQPPSGQFEFKDIVKDSNTYGENPPAVFRSDVCVVWAPSQIFSFHSFCIDIHRYWSGSHDPDR